MTQIKKQDLKLLTQKEKDWRSEPSTIDPDIFLEDVIVRKVEFWHSFEIDSPPYIGIVTKEQLINGGTIFNLSDDVVVRAPLLIRNGIPYHHTNVVQPSNYERLKMYRRYKYDCVKMPYFIFNNLINAVMRGRIINCTVSGEKYEDKEYILGKGYMVRGEINSDKFYLDPDRTRGYSCYIARKDSSDEDILAAQQAEVDRWVGTPKEQWKAAQFYRHQFQHMDILRSEYRQIEQQGKRLTALMAKQGHMQLEVKMDPKMIIFKREPQKKDEPEAA